jgi:hypothetical protein
VSYISFSESFFLVPFVRFWLDPKRTTTSKNELATYYRKRIAEGKHKNKVKNALVFKMITRAFAAVKRQSPYLQIDKYRNAA